MNLGNLVFIPKLPKFPKLSIFFLPLLHLHHMFDAEVFNLLE